MSGGHNMSKYELPIALNATITSECWTFFKSCIIETTKRGQDWLASHMNVYFDGQNVFFGEDLIFYPIHYFETILSIRATDINRVSVNNVTTYIKNRLLNREYVIIECNIFKISDENDSRFFIHEILIFGFDDEKKVFYSPLLNKSTGKPDIVEIPYHRLEVSFKQMKEYYKAHRDVEFWRTYRYFFPITIVKLKNYSDSTTNLIYKCLKKLEYEYNAEKHTYTRYKDNFDISNTWERYVGIGCLWGVIQLIDKTLNKGYDLKNGATDFTLSLMRLYEHRIILLKTLQLLDSLTHQSISSNYNGIELYEKCCVKMKRCYMIAQKWNILSHDKHLEEIKTILNENFREEPQILKRSYQCVRAYLIGR